MTLMIILIIMCGTCLTGMKMSNASLLDESTAGAEAMSMCYSLKNQKKKSFFVDENCHPQNIALAQTRGDALGMNVVVGAAENMDLSGGDFCGVMVQVNNAEINFSSYLFSYVILDHNHMRMVGDYPVEIAI